jgi:hypothetical protein
MSVAMLPGAIALTLILYLAHSFDNALVSCNTAPLAAEYEATRNPPMNELSEATLMILPLFREIKCSPACCERMNKELRLTSRTWSQQGRRVKTCRVPVGSSHVDRVFPHEHPPTVDQDVDPLWGRVEGSLEDQTAVVQIGKVSLNYRCTGRSRKSVDRILGRRHCHISLYQNHARSSLSQRDCDTLPDPLGKLQPRTARDTPRDPPVTNAVRPWSENSSSTGLEGVGASESGKAYSDMTVAKRGPSAARAT